MPSQKSDGRSQLVEAYRLGRISRRQLMTRAAALGVSGSLGMGLSHPLSAAPQQAIPLRTLRTEEPTPGGTLVVGLVAEPISMDPAVVTDINSMRIHPSLFDTLVTHAPGSLDLVPSLAEAWEISEDGLAYTFHLIDGVTFHDGTNLDAEAVKFSFERMLDPDHPFADTGPFGFAETFYGPIAQIETPDPRTVRFILSTKFGPFLGNLAEPQGGIVSPTALETYHLEFGDNAVGSGPFRLVRWEHNVEVILERNDDYWAGAPFLDRVIFRPILEEQVRLTELLSGGANFIVDVPPDNIADLRDDASFTVHEQPGPHLWWLYFNTSMPPFDDVRVRRAATHAVNREAIVNDILQGTGTVAVGPIPPAIPWAYTDDVTTYPYDPERARELLAEAGYADGFEVTFWVAESGSGMQSPRTMGTAIQADLAAVGISARIETYEWGTYIDKWIAGMQDEAHLCQASWMFTSGDPDAVLMPALHSKSGDLGFANAGEYENEQIDQLLQEARVTVDIEDRAPLYHEVQRIAAEDVPWLYVDNAIQNAATTANVQGFTLNPDFLLYFHSTWIDD